MCMIVVLVINIINFTYGKWVQRGLEAILGGIFCYSHRQHIWHREKGNLNGKQKNFV